MTVWHELWSVLNKTEICIFMQLIYNRNMHLHAVDLKYCFAFKMSRGILPQLLNQPKGIRQRNLWMPGWHKINWFIDKKWRQDGHMGLNKNHVIEVHLCLHSCHEQPQQHCCQDSVVWPWQVLGIESLLLKIIWYCFMELDDSIRYRETMMKI